jgi:UDP-N-acetylmuramoyl-tripeptide--D-alanyl-D-alanine ligase
MWKISDLSKVTAGKVIGSFIQDGDYSLSFDSRSKVNGSIFLALKGDQFDAHNFLVQAYQNGAVGFIAHNDPSQDVQDQLKSLSAKLQKPEAFFIHVNDTLMALHQLANFYRKRLKAKVLAVAGSNGKTTTKEFLATICKEAGKTHFSQGSFNNHWGVPFTILSCPQDAQYLILEMGMNHAGELKQLTEIAQPDVSVLTMVGVEHIEHFGTLEKIAEAEEEIFKYASPQSFLVINKDNFYTSRMLAKFNNKSYTFSSVDKKSDVHFKSKDDHPGALSFEATISGHKKDMKLNLFGQHNLTNLMAAAAVAMAAQILPETIFYGLQKCKGYWGRNQWIMSEKGFDILFDGYNSSPESLAALVDNVKQLKLNSDLFAVIGQMKELGSLSMQYHIEAGRKLAQLDFKKVWFIGDDAEYFQQGYLEELAERENSSAAQTAKPEVSITKDYDSDFANQFASQLRSTDLVLVKGSRGVFLEKFVRNCWPVDFKDKP